MRNSPDGIWAQALEWGKKLPQLIGEIMDIDNIYLFFSSFIAITLFGSILLIILFNNDNRKE